MDALSTVLIALIVLNSLLLVWLLVGLKRWWGRERDPQLDSSLQHLKVELINQQMEGLVSLRESLDSANRIVNERLAEGNTALDRRMAVFAEIENKLGQLATQAQNIENIGKNIQSLSDLLKPPKVRGGLGEILLENLLSQILPTALYQTQYRYSGGQRVDAVISVGDMLLPVDSKFPLESFQRYLQDGDQASRRELGQAFKKHIDDINGKYIRPDEGTADIAIMYIPSEAVYYQFVSRRDNEGLEYAMAKKVIPSSPGHLYAFLASLSALYRQIGLSSDSRLLLQGLDNLAEALSRLNRLHERLEGSLRSMTGSLSKAREESKTMTYQLDRLQEPSAGIGVGDKKEDRGEFSTSD